LHKKGNVMPDTGRDPIVETPMQARQAEPGPSILVLLLASTALAVIVMGLVWAIFFRT
jgi:hypothetical protein